MTVQDRADQFDGPLRYAALSDVGTERVANEDACGAYLESPTHALVVVADGVSGEEGADIASRTAVDVTLRAYAESPPTWGPSKRLYRAVQQANIEIHDRALVVTELRRMASTLTAAVIDGPTVHAAHVGDTRLYTIRGSEIVQRTKDHTVAASRRRWRRGSAQLERDHPDRSILTRSLGRELIAAVDRITFPMAAGDALVICSDGLYTVLEDAEILAIAGSGAAPAACRALLDAANARGTSDNLTAAVVQVTGEIGPPAPPRSWRRFLGDLLK
jgi:protein phosphatase